MATAEQKPHIPKTELQIPDERDILKRRLKADRRKQQLAAAHITIREGTGADGVSVITANHNKGGHQEAAGARDFTPVTLVVQDLRYFVPNPAYGGGSKPDAGGKLAMTADQAAAVEVPKELELLKGAFLLVPEFSARVPVCYVTSHHLLAPEMMSAT